MAREAICTGKTVEEALEKAYAQLGVASDNAEFEILERPKRSLFGLRVTPAKVRVFVEEPEPAPAPAPRRAAEPQQRQEQRPAQQKERPQQPAAPKQERPAPQKPAEPAAPPKEMTEEGRAKMACAAEYLRDIFNAMGLQGVELATKENGSGVIFTLSGEGLGVLIGRRGETLDALQYLSGLVANRLEGEYFRVTIDSGNYREKREKTLAQLARKLSSQVVKTGRSMTLEPMNPYERRIIHATVQEIDGVTSSSIGEEPNRRVVISSTNPRKPQRQGTGNRGAGGGNRDGANRDGGSRDGGNRRPGGRGGRPGGRPQRDNRTGPSNVTTRPNAFGQGGANAHIDDSAYEIEPPVRTQRLPEAAPQKAPATVEEPSKALYSKIEIDD